MCNCVRFKTTECNCISEIQEKTKIAIEKANPSYSVTWVHIPVTSTQSKMVGVRAYYSGEETLKNGKTKHIEKEVNIIATHCPFCGEKYPEY